MKEISIDSGNVTSVLQNQGILEAFPFFRAMLEGKAAGCGRCGRKREVRKPDPEYLVRRISQLTPADKARFKQILNVGLVRLSYRAGAKIYKVVF